VKKNLPKIKRDTGPSFSGHYGWDNGWVFSDELPSNHVGHRQYMKAKYYREKVKKNTQNASG
jgi:hypothetical protein